jgi:hypothetical protein
LIIVPGRVLGPRGREPSLRFAVDTGAGQTTTSPELLDELGYSAREHGDQLAVTRSVVGREAGYMLRVARFTSSASRSKTQTGGPDLSIIESSTNILDLRCPATGQVAVPSSVFRTSFPARGRTTWTPRTREHERLRWRAECSCGDEPTQPSRRCIHEHDHTNRRLDVSPDVRDRQEPRRREILKARDTWPETARVYCRPHVGPWPDDAELVEATPIVLCNRRGPAIDLVLDRPEH